MRPLDSYTIGCVIHDASPRARCRAAIEREGLNAVLDRPEALEHPGGHAGYAGIVYDLSPWDDSCGTRLHQLRHVRPDVPVLLYFPPKQAAFDVLSSCGQLAQLRFRVQALNEQPDGVHRDVRWLVRSIPQERVAAALQRSLSGLGPTPLLVGRSALRYLAGGHRPRISDIGRDLKLSSRTLQRRFSHVVGVTPKQFIDLITVWYVQHVARTTGRSLATVATRIAMPAGDYYRLARRVRAGTAVRPRWVQDCIEPACHRDGHRRFWGSDAGPARAEPSRQRRQLTSWAAGPWEGRLSVGGRAL